MKCLRLSRDSPLLAETIGRRRSSETGFALADDHEPGVLLHCTFEILRRPDQWNCRAQIETKRQTVILTVENIGAAAESFMNLSCHRGRIVRFHPRHPNSHRQWKNQRAASEIRENRRA